MEVPYHYTPRSYQEDFLTKMREARIGVLKWARRAGKGLSTFAYAITRMVEEPMGVVIIYPTKQQGYDAFWNNVENDGFRTIEHVPKVLIESINSTVDNMSMRLKNGSTLTLVGANANPESLRGQNTKLYILSEFVDISPGVLGIIRPIVAANNGQIIIESTVKQDGVQGATFLRLFAAAEKDPTQYASRVLATEYMTDEELEQVRQDYIAEYGNDFLFRQEFLLDEGQALATSYYGNLLTKMKKEERIGINPYNPDYPVYTSWDLGKGAGTTAIVFWQYYDKTMHYIDAYESHNLDDESLIKFVLSKPYNYEWHFWPHDGTTVDSDKIQRIEKARSYGLLNSSILPRTGDKEIRIKKLAERLAEPTTTMHEPTMSTYIDKLKLYKRKWNPITGDYEGPEHKTASHIADAFGYSEEAIDQAFDPVTGKFYYSSGEEETTQSEELVTSLSSWGDELYEDDYDF